MGPYNQGSCYNACNVNVFRFRTKSYEANKTTQNSGVMCRADTTSFANRRDMNPIASGVNYYGVLTNIIKIQYTNDLKFLLFKCDWVDGDRGVKVDELKFTLVNLDRLMYRENRDTDEPFVLANQVEQVWYSRCPRESSYHVVMPMMRRDNYDVYSRDHDIEAFPAQQLDSRPVIRDDDVVWVREGIRGEEVDLDGRRTQGAT